MTHTSESIPIIKAVHDCTTFWLPVGVLFPTPQKGTPRLSTSCIGESHLLNRMALCAFLSTASTNCPRELAALGLGIVLGTELHLVCVELCGVIFDIFIVLCNFVSLSCFPHLGS